MWEGRIEKTDTQTHTQNDYYNTSHMHARRGLIVVFNPSLGADSWNGIFATPSPVLLEASWDVHQKNKQNKLTQHLQLISIEPWEGSSVLLFLSSALCGMPSSSSTWYDIIWLPPVNTPTCAWGHQSPFSSMGIWMDLKLWDSWYCE